MVIASLAGQTFAAHAEREKERLVTLDTFLWTSPECWRHQSDWRAFNNCIYLRIGHMIRTDSNENKNRFASQMSFTVASKRQEQHATIYC